MTSNDETLSIPLTRPSDNSLPVTKKPPFPSASKWGRLVSSSLGCPPPGTGNTQPSTPTDPKPEEPAAEQKAADGGGAVKQSRWGRLKSSGSDSAVNPSHAKLSKTVSASATVGGSQNPAPDAAPPSSAGGVTVHVTAAELNPAKPEASRPPQEAAVLGDLRNELHAVTQQMQRVEARLDIMFRMFTAFISGSGLKAAPGDVGELVGPEVVDLSGGVVRRSPGPRSRGNSMDMAAASVFSSRLNSVTSEEDIAVVDGPSNHTTFTDVTSTLSPPPPPKPPALGTLAKPPTLVRVRPLTGGGPATADMAAAMENPAFIASPEAQLVDSESATKQAHKTTSGDGNVSVSDDQGTTHRAQTVPSVCKTSLDAAPHSVSTTSGLTTSTSAVSTSGLSTSAGTASVARSTSVNERLSVSHMSTSSSAPSAEGLVDRPPHIRSPPPPPPVRRQSGAGPSPGTGRSNDPRLRTTLV